MSRKITTLVVTALMGFVGIWYCYLIIIAAIKPVLAMWLLFAGATAMGLGTYFSEKTQERSFATNIANTVDVAVTWSILIVLVTFGHDVRTSFTWFETLCFSIGGIILMFWTWQRSRGAKAANIAVNVLIMIGYLPLIAHLWSSTENTEDFVIWGTVWGAQVVALYNPLRAKDFLAALYASRALILVSVILTLMMRLELKT